MFDIILCKSLIENLFKNAQKLSKSMRFLILNKILRFLILNQIPYIILNQSHFKKHIRNEKTFKINEIPNLKYISVYYTI